MTIENTKKQPSITFCFDDERNIERMKEAGIWEQMQEAMKAQTTVLILHNNELFIWHSCPTDSGYSLSKSNNRAELMLVMTTVLRNTAALNSQTMH